MNLFKGLIICKQCGKKYNFKPDNGSKIYICSGYKNYGSSFCKRNIVREQDIVDLVTLHLAMPLKNIILSEEIIKEHIDRIEVNGQMISIFYKDGSKTEWTNSHLSI